MRGAYGGGAGGWGSGTPHDGSLAGNEWGGRGEGGSGAHPGRGAPLFADLSPRRNNGRDNDTGGGISAATDTPATHTPSPNTPHPPRVRTGAHHLRSALKSARSEMNGRLIAFICYHYHN